ncbi:MAG: carboxypeptidase-like regulatory domain-containing protein [Owenweeksia sp.]|nr:carboxypeptidase-like regulatory domain-containing protein [Owenweeksia sp.]
MRGTVTDKQTGEPVPFANVVIKDNAGDVVAGGATDFDGRYDINPVNAGTYNVEASFAGYAKVTVTDIRISPNVPTYQDFKLSEESSVLKEVTIEYEAPLIDRSKSGTTTTAEDITNMAVRDITSVASQAGRCYAGCRG